MWSFLKELVCLCICACVSGVTDDFSLDHWLSALTVMDLIHTHTHTGVTTSTHPLLSCYPVFPSPVTLSSLVLLEWQLLVCLGIRGYSPEACAGGPRPVSTLWILKPEMDGREPPLPWALCSARLSCSSPLFIPDPPLEQNHCWQLELLISPFSLRGWKENLKTKQAHLITKL